MNDMFDKNIKSKFRAENRITESERIEQEKLNNKIAWITYFRQNPARFAVEYLGIKGLAFFQRFLLHIMFQSVNFYWIASRGVGKSYLSWLYAIIRCILYPGTQVVITCTSQSQATKIMNQKISEFTNNYPNIDKEIENIITGKEPKVVFRNGSCIYIASPSVGSLGFRANVIIIDEYRYVNDEIIKTVFRKFLTSARKPKYLLARDENGELIHKNYKPESNTEIYISSQAPTYEIAYTRYRNAINNMLKLNGYAAMCTPYYLGVKEGIILKEKIIKELKEEGADMSVFALEYECVPYGSNENSYFSSEMFVSNRRIDKIFIPMAARDYLENRGDLTKNPFYIKKVTGEKRLVAVDTALAGTSNSANSIVECIRLIPKEAKKTRKNEKGNNESYIEKYYQKEVVYLKNLTGDLSPSTQAKIIKRMFYLFEADTLVIDAQGVSLGIIYQLTVPTYDDEYNMEYPAYSSFNDVEVSGYCKVPQNERLEVIYSVKVSGGSALDTQHKYNTYTRSELLAKRISLPVIETTGEEYLRRYFDYDKQSPDIQAEWISVFKQTDSLIAEAVNLERKNDSMGRVLLKIPEKSSVKRRDRIIALQYALLYAQELEIKDFRQKNNDFVMYNFNTNVVKSGKSKNPFANNFNKVRGFGWYR